ncbi:ankyrin repeat domain-containing protein [Rickettsia endosymbiont of Halotydeus destructor]|uniref:ankyrin repeat domain-containing protein n=1 Tax=Rickettsia endosymbiont of Halotydeus destructor TaxID=2996754 RepID=UPI003BAFE11A
MSEEFLKAVRDNHLSKVKKLISLSDLIDLNAVDKSGKTALQYAIINNNPELIKLFIGFGANINVKTRQGKNLFDLAMDNKSVSDETYILLLKAGVDVSTMSPRKFYPLLNKLFPILLKSEIDISTTIGKFKRTLLHYVAEDNNIKTAEILISHNIDVQAQEITGNTALHMARAPKMVKILLKAGSNIEAKNRLGRTPLHNAILYANKRNINIKDNYNAVLKLIKNGANPNAVDYYGFSPLDYAIRIKNPKIFELLINEGAKIKENSYELFCQALEHGNFVATKYLFKQEFLNKIDDKNGRNYLHLAAIGGNKAVLEYLVKQNPINKEELSQSIDKQGNTPIHIAAQNNQLAIIEDFQKIGFDINARNANGDTVLHIVAATQNSEMIKELIELGADINIKNKIGETALDKMEQGSKNINKKLSNKELQELFKESNIIARTGEVSDETKYLHQYRLDGDYKNMERDGNRGRSATLLVPDVNISLFHTGIGLLYNADESTIRHFMPHDFWTDNARRTEDFFNMKIDSKKFVQTQSKKEFIKTYKGFLKDNPQKDYNEIIANLYPKGLIGIALQDDDPSHKLSALEAKYYVSEKYGMDLPMTIVKNGKLIPWNPKTTEIGKLLAKVKQKDISEYGFVKKRGELTLLNKNEVTYNEVKNFFEGIDKNNTENNLKKLLKLVNKRLKDDNLSTVSTLKDFIIHKQDIKDLLTELEKDKAIKLNEQELEAKVLEALSSMQSARSNKNSLPQLEKYNSIKDILSQELAEEKRIPSIIDGLKELIQGDIIEDLKQSRNHKEFKEKVDDIVNIHSQEDIVPVKQKLKTLDKWCEEIIKTDNSPTFKNISNIVKHAFKAVINIGNKTVFEEEKKKMHFYINAIKDARKNILTSIEKIRETIKKDNSPAVIPQKNQKPKKLGKGIVK